MEIQTRLANQCTEIDVHRSPEPVPTSESLFLLAFDVPQGIADVLKIEFHTTLEQARPLTVPLSEEVAVWPLACLMTVRAAQSFLLSFLRISTCHK